MLTFYGSAQEIAVQAAIKEAKKARKERLMAHIVNLESRSKEKKGKLVQAQAKGMERRQGQERGVEQSEQFQVRFS